VGKAEKGPHLLEATPDWRGVPVKADAEAAVRARMATDFMVNNFLKR